VLAFARKKFIIAFDTDHVSKHDACWSLFYDS
jgi:hypothetical protein